MVAAYLIGAIPVGLLIGKSRGVDIRTVGSGNIGATNVVRAVGWRWGILAFLCDVAKGFAPPMIAAHALNLTGWPLAVCGSATVAGHCFSPYIGFAGGKGIATALGLALALCWPAGLLAFATWIAVTAATRYVSIGSMVGSAAACPLAWAFKADWPTVIMIGLTALLCNVQHRSNLRRLLAGTERRMGQKQTTEGLDDDSPPEPSTPDATAEGADA